MRIERLSDPECYETLIKAGFGRLACARDAQPYVVPIYFVVGDAGLYSFALPGQKIDWMRLNPRVCIETDAVSAGSDWTTVVVFGRYLELTDDPELMRERDLAHRLLQGRPMWWEPGATPVADQAGQAEGAGHDPIFYRVTIDSLSGYRAVPASDERISGSASA